MAYGVGVNISLPPLPWGLFITFARVIIALPHWASPSINIMVEDELLGYDDTASVAFIRNYIPQELKELLSDDDIVYFVDLIYDYYESRGYLSDDDADDEEPIEIDEDELVDYVVRNAQKDGVGKFDPDQIRFVVQGELEYCESINLFD